VAYNEKKFEAALMDRDIRLCHITSANSALKSHRNEVRMVETNEVIETRLASLKDVLLPLR
jgi:hypothetical protein